MSQMRPNSNKVSGSSMQDCESADLAVAEAMEEYLQLLESAKPIDRESFLAKHPHISEQLSDAIASLEFVTRLTAKAASGLPEEGPSVGHASGVGESAEALGDFRIICEIGRGGMGVVYEAEQRSLGRKVALKVMPFASLLDPRQIERFRNETRAAAMLRHSNIVSVHSVGCERGVHYYAMDLIDGCSLADLVSRLAAQNESRAGDLSTNNSRVDRKADGPEAAPGESLNTVPVAQLSTKHSTDLQSYFRSIAKLGMQAADALHFAHQSGVVHRDIKPSNLLLDQTGQIHITDFGLARIETNDSITLTGDLVGTLRYMSPEQVEGHVADERSDVYSLGATLFELATLRPPYNEEHRGRLMRAILESPVPSANRLSRDIPRDLATILDKCLQKSPTGRYRSAKECADDLRRFLEHRSITARPTNGLDRLRYFARRSPALATSIAAAFMLMTLLAGVSSLLAWSYRQQANIEAEHIAQAEASARLQRISRYANEMRIGKIMADERQLVELQDHLLRWVPEDGDEDLRGFEWFHLWQYCNDPAVIHTYDHELPTFQVTFVGDSEIVSSGFSGQARIWPLHKGDRSKPRMYLPLDGGEVEALLYDDQGRRIFTSDGTETICVWDSETGQRVKEISLRESKHKGHLNRADSLDLSDNGGFLLVGSGSWEAGAVRLIDLANGKTTMAMDQPSRALAVFGPENRVVAANASSNQFRIIDHTTGETIESHTINADGTWALSISDDRALISLGSMIQRGNEFTYRVEVRRTSDWQQVWSMPAASRPQSIDFSADGTMLAWSDQKGFVQIVEINTDGTQENLWPRRQLHAQTIYDLEFSSDRKMLATASGDGYATIWDVQELRKPAPPEVDFPKQHFRSFGSCFVDEQLGVATTYRTKGVLLWNSTDGALIENSVPEKETERWLGMDSAPQVGLVGIFFGFWPAPDPSDRRRSQIVVWDSKRGEVHSRFDNLPPVGNSVTSCSFSPNGRYFAVSSHYEGVLVVDVDAKTVTRTLPNIHCKTLRFSRDSKSLAIGASEGKAYIVSVPEFSVIETFNLDTRLVDSIDISPDGRFVTGVGYDRHVNLYDRQTGKSRAFIEKLGGFPTIVRFSPDGKRILTGSLDGKVRLWLTETGDQVMNWDIPANNWPSAGFSSQGNAIVVGGISFAKVIHAPISVQLRRLSASALRNRACQNASTENQ